MKSTLNHRVCWSLIWITIWFLPVTATAEITAQGFTGLRPAVANFSLLAAGGETISLDSDAQVTVLCFLGCECPLAKRYGPRLQTMADEFASQGVRFIGVNSNPQDSMSKIEAYVAEHEIRFPLVKDFDQRVALDFGATRTPEVFVIDAAGHLVYRGRIDDQYQVGVARAAANRHDLRDAIEQALAGEAIATPVTEAVGCLIALPRQTSQANRSQANRSQTSQAASGEILPTTPGVTYCNQVSRILSAHCVECHRSGEIGPFALQQYDEVVGWADMMLEVIDQGRMPPWHADPSHGEFLNARHMPDEDKSLLQQWVDQGMPYGEARDLPTPAEYLSGWRLPREPDAVYPMSDQPFEVPADGIVEYQYFVIDPQFTEDRWVRAVQVVPGNAAVVHHCIAFTRPPDGAAIRQFGMLAAYVPGQVDAPLPPGYAQRIPAGTKLVLQMHYTPTGSPQQDLTKLGIVFADQHEVTHEVYATGGIEQEFEIPPHAANHLVTGNVNRFPRDGELLSIIPHMHVRGRSFSLAAQREGQSETLLQVPKYDFNWQHNYRLAEPLRLADVDELSFRVIFDNSADNPSNPDPNQHVTWGDQTWEEMAVVFLSVARPLALDDAPSEPDAAMPASPQPSVTARTHAKATAFAESYMERFDRNRDGVLTPHELPHSVRIFAFGSLDRDGSGDITMEEIKWHALRRESITQ